MIQDHEPVHRTPIAVRPQTVKKLRELLEADLGPKEWTDPEMEQMASELVELVRLVRSISFRRHHNRPLVSPGKQVANK